MRTNIKTTDEALMGNSESKAKKTRKTKDAPENCDFEKSFYDLQKSNFEMEKAVALCEVFTNDAFKILSSTLDDVSNTALEVSEEVRESCFHYFKADLDQLKGPMDAESFNAKVFLTKLKRVLGVWKNVFFNRFNPQVDNMISKLKELKNKFKEGSTESFPTLDNLKLKIGCIHDSLNEIDKLNEQLKRIIGAHDAFQNDGIAHEQTLDALEAKRVALVVKLKDQL